MDGLARPANLKLSLLDVVIAVGRKTGGFVALLTLGWVYFRLLVLGHTLHQIYPDASDPDLRHTLWVALLLIMAQGWDISFDQIALDWTRLQAQLPSTPRGDLPLLARSAVRGASALWAGLEPTVTRLGHFMDLCVALANKVGALAVFGYLMFLAEQFWLYGASVREMYPTAADPTVSFLADLCVYVVVLGWWATPFAQIKLFWERLRLPARETPLSRGVAQTGFSSGRE